MNEGKSNRKWPKMFAGKKIQMTKKASRANLIRKRPDTCVKNRCVGAR